MDDKFDADLGEGDLRGPVLDPAAVERMRRSLPVVGDQTVRAIHDEVSAYARALSGAMGATIREAVRQALDGFLRLATRAGDELAVPNSPVREAAYALGRGEARAGRSVDALLAAYRVGARVSWHELSATAVDAGVSAGSLARFAELVFAYIDDLSAASVAGHTDELAAAGMLRERRLARLAAHLLEAAEEDQVVEAARLADWEQPTSLTAVLVAAAHVRTVLALVDSRTLRAETDDDLAVLLVPDVAGSSGRSALLTQLGFARATVGPERPWLRVHESHGRALRVREEVGLPSARAQDTEEHLVSLVLGADPVAMADLRARVLAPLDEESPSSRDRLEETLRAWWAYAGRRAEVAEALHVHPQTVRYRMGRVRDLFGDTWEDPEVVLGLGIVLASVSSGKPETS